MSICTVRLCDTSNVLTLWMSSEQIHLRVSPNLFGVSSWILQMIRQWIVQHVFCQLPLTVSHEMSSLPTECSLDRLPFSFVNGQEWMIWDIVWISPQRHKSVLVCCHSSCVLHNGLVQCRDQHCWKRSKSGCWTVGLSTNWPPRSTLKSSVNWQLMSTGCNSHHSSFLDDSQCSEGSRMSWSVGQLSWDNQLYSHLGSWTCLFVTQHLSRDRGSLDQRDFH